MLRALLLLLPLAASAQAPEAARAAVLDASGVVAMVEGAEADRTVEVVCPEGATCRLLARTEPLASGAVAVSLRSDSGLACSGAAPCEIARGLPEGRSLVSVAFAAETGDLAPAGAHAFHLQFWVVADPVPHGAFRPFTRSHPGTPHPLLPLYR